MDQAADIGGIPVKLVTFAPGPRVPVPGEPFLGHIAALRFCVTTEEASDVLHRWVRRIQRTAHRQAGYPYGRRKRHRKRWLREQR